MDQLRQRIERQIFSLKADAHVDYRASFTLTPYPAVPAVLRDIAEAPATTRITGRFGELNPAAQYRVTARRSHPRHRRHTGWQQLPSSCRKKARQSWRRCFKRPASSFAGSLKSWFWDQFCPHCGV
jgi:hypothetical protein